MQYIDSAYQPEISFPVSEEVQPGELVFLPEGGDLRRATGDDPRIDGVATAHDSGSYIADGDEDYRSSMDQFTYQPSDDHAPSFGGAESHARLRLRTAEDNGTDPAASISPFSVVGLASPSGTLASADEFKGRLVEEGYTDGASTPTTYSRSNSNFLAIGLALPNERFFNATNDVVVTNDKPLNQFDETFHVLRRTDL